MTVRGSYIDIGMGGHFEGFGGCEGKTCNLSHLSAQNLLQALHNIRFTDIGVSSNGN